MHHPFGLPETLPGTHAPARIWAPLIDVDHAAQRQIRAVADLPWTHGVAIMPDVHVGAAVTIGSVIAMRDAVSPAAVGGDIGCGMMAVRTNLTTSDLPNNLAPLRAAWEAAVPVGPNHHATRAPILKTHGLIRQQLTRHFQRFTDLSVDVSASEQTAIRQCGTLGGGNHFIELCADTTETIWLTLHSGSRNIGKEIAHRHIGRAKTLDWNRHGPNNNLPVILRKNATGAEQTEWADYLHDLTWAQDYAALNRTIMMATIKTALHNLLPQVRYTTEINCHHNYVAIEHHDGMELAITRKGAISATSGEWGIIPGSMGTGAAIVRGLGNPAAYCSASHGAGRIMSRSEARRSFTLYDLAHQTAGVECRKDPGVLDEIPGAYKNLDQVLAYEQDLVTVETNLTTLLCVKG